MKDIFKQGLRYTPAVESGILDGHLFLDITGTGRLYGPPPDVAFRLKKSIQKTMGLDPIWSLATNKLVAKVATRVVKPAGEYIVGPGEEAAFLAPLPVRLLPGLSKAEIQTATRFNLVRVSQVRSLTPDQLNLPFPGRTNQIRRLLRGEDMDPVAQSPAPVFRADHEFTTDTNGAEELKAGIALLSADLCTRLRRRGRHPGRLSLTISYSDGVCRTKSMPGTIAREPALLKKTWALFLAAWNRRVRIRHISLSCPTAPERPVQGTLFPDIEPQRAETSSPGTGATADRLAKAMDEIRAQFGRTALRTATAMALPCSP